MKQIQFSKNSILDFIDETELWTYESKLYEIDQSKISSGDGDWTGWYQLPKEYKKTSEYQEMKKVASEIYDSEDYLVVVGIGGSYLGAKAVIEALSPAFEESKIIFAGFHLEPQYLDQLLKFLDDKDFYVNVISKSGTTIEPAMSFRYLKQLLERKYSKEEAAKRIIATTDSSKGLLRELTDKQGYRNFIIPDNVGGRFSVLTPVGLLPIMAAGFDTDALLDGAASALDTASERSMQKNPVYQYAAIRDILYRAGKSTEVFSTFSPALKFFSEWWKQLFGESEGKDGKGIFPASTAFTTDLHSLGQWIQDGPRNIMETFLFVEDPNRILFPMDEENVDQLNYLVGKDVNTINKMAYEGTLKAHTDGQVPSVTFTISELNEFALGELIFFFEKTTALCGYLLGVDPFNQPGVEAYKKNMFHLLGRPGY